MLPKVLVIVSLVCAAVHADAPTAQYLPPGGNGGSNGYGGARLNSGATGLGASNGGTSGYGASGGSYRDAEEGGQPEPYSFNYEVKDPESGNDYSHKADSDGNTVKGEYKVLLPDGRRQTVTYTADEQGYNADVQYEGEAINTAGGDTIRSEASGPGYPASASGGPPTGGSAGSAPGGFLPTAGAPAGTGFGPSAGASASGSGGYPSGAPPSARQASSNGYPRPTSNYLPPGK